MNGRQQQCSRTLGLLTLVAAAFAALLTLSGCSTLTEPTVYLADHTQRPPAAVVLITVDGLAAYRFEQFLADGDLPNIQTFLVENGVHVRRAVASQPTITYANLVTILSGRHPGHHGILGNKWFDRYALVHRDYTTAATYRLVDGDHRAPTLYEEMDPDPCVSIQCAGRRGAARMIDNWASSGIRWFFGALQDIDRLVPRRMDLVSESANQWGQWPKIIHAYMPAVDETGHRFGPSSAAYRSAVINVDRQVGRLHKAVVDAGMINRTWFVLVADHGQVDVPPDKHFDVPDFLRQAGLSVKNKPLPAAPFEQRQKQYAETDAVVVVGGDRRAVVHLRGPDGWHQPADQSAVQRLVDPSHVGDPSSLWSSPAVGLALAPRRDGSTGETAVDVYSRQGHSRLRSRFVDGRREYGYEVVTADALDGAIPAEWHDAETWLTLSADGDYPDFVVSVLSMFDSPRAGDIVLVAADGWDFTPGNNGGHGGVDSREMLVPMVLAGPGVEAGVTIDHARLVDVAPTILGIVRGRPVNNPHDHFDGVDRLAFLEPADDGAESEERE